MSDTVTRVLAGCALLGVLGNAAMLWRVDRQVGALETEVTKLPAVLATEAAAVHRAKVGVESFRAGAGADPGSRRDDPPAAGADPRLERRELIANQWRDAALDEVTAFANDEGLDQGALDAITDEILTAADSMAAIKDEVRAGGVSMLDGRNQMRDAKDASDQRLDRLLGKDRADRLRDRLRDTRPF